MSETNEAFATIKLHKRTIARLRKAQQQMADPPMRPPTLSGVLELALDSLLRRRGKQQ